MAAPSSARNFSTPATPVRDFDSLTEPVTSTSPSSSRKKKVDVTNHHRYKKKKLLNSAEGKIARRNCQHQSVNSFCKVSVLSGDDINYNFQKLYNCESKVDQDAVILKLLEISTAKRPRVSVEARRKAKANTIKYFLLNSTTRDRVEVCKASFISILCKYCYTQYTGYST